MLSDCVSVCPFKLLNQVNDFHEPWYEQYFQERYATGRKPNVTVVNLILSIIIRQTNEVEATLGSLNIRS
jgi:hypothetical protein